MLRKLDVAEELQLQAPPPLKDDTRKNSAAIIPVHLESQDESINALLSYFAADWCKILLHFCRKELSIRCENSQVISSFAKNSLSQLPLFITFAKCRGIFDVASKKVITGASLLPPSLICVGFEIAVMSLVNFVFID